MYAAAKALLNPKVELRRNRPPRTTGTRVTQRVRIRPGESHEAAGRRALARLRERHGNRLNLSPKDAKRLDRAIDRLLEGSERVS